MSDTTRKNVCLVCSKLSTVEYFIGLAAGNSTESTLKKMKKVPHVTQQTLKEFKFRATYEKQIDSEGTTNQRTFEFFLKLVESESNRMVSDDIEIPIHAVVIGLDIPNDLDASRMLANRVIDSLRIQKFQGPILYFIAPWRFDHIKWSVCDIQSETAFPITQTILDNLRIEPKFIDKVIDQLMTKVSDASIPFKSITLSCDSNSTKSTGCCGH